MQTTVRCCGCSSSRCLPGGGGGASRVQQLQQLQQQQRPVVAAAAMAAAQLGSRPPPPAAAATVAQAAGRVLPFNPLAGARRPRRRLALVAAGAAATPSPLSSSGGGSESAAGGGDVPPAAAAATAQASSTAAAAAQQQQQQQQQQLLQQQLELQLPENFCIIEGRDAVKDFASLPLEDIRANIAARRDRIFLLMEELRRLRIQQRLKGGDEPARVEVEAQQYLSALPFLPPLSEKTLRTYYSAYAAFFAAVIVFGGLLAPLLEVRIGLGGSSYLEFIQGLHLPAHLAEVDPIVASFCGGAVGAVSALLVVEVNNIKQQIHNRCHYCQGAGYLTCGHCVGGGTEPCRPGEPCAFCAGSGKVMCTGCLCTGKQMATEHDPRIDPFT